VSRFAHGRLVAMAGLLLPALVAGCAREGCTDDSCAPAKAVVSKKIGSGECPDCDNLTRGGLLTGAVQGGGGKAAADAGVRDGNLVNRRDKNILTDWNVEDGKHQNVKWSAATGTKGYFAPVIAGGKVFISTNNRQPRDAKIKGDHAILMCFNEKDGKFLWQAAYDMAPPEVDQQAAIDGLCSRPAVEGDRAYIVTPGCQVVCVDTGSGKTLWKYDLMKELKVYPCIINACSPLLVGDRLFVMTANGVTDTGNVQAPKAPSFVALNKKDGSLLWQSNLPGENIIHGQWSNPVYAEPNGKPQVIFAAGDGYLYGLDPATGKPIWKFQCTPGSDKAKGENRAKLNYPVSTPVVAGNRLYLGIGHAPDTGVGSRVGHFWCVDITKSGDVSPAPGDFNPKSPQNKNSGLVWHYGGEIQPKPKMGRQVAFGPTISTCVVHDGLVYVSEENGYLHCLDAATGQKYWEHDFKCAVWASPYWVDGKVYIGVEDGTAYIFAHGKDKKVIAEIDMGETIQCAPVVANGVLYVTTRSKVYALGK
jgi:outer membrane protein assembly factor BamB